MLSSPTRSRRSSTAARFSRPVHSPLATRALRSFGMAIPILTVVTLIVGCGDKNTAPGVSLTLDDGIVPDILFEGEAATISAWGQLNREQFTKLEAEVISWPAHLEAGVIEVRAVGSADNTSGGSFHGQAVLAHLREGEYGVRLIGAEKRHHLSVLRVEPWIEYRSFQDPVRPDAALSIQQNGIVVVGQTDRERTARINLLPWALEEVEMQFESAEFPMLEDEYLSADDRATRRIEIVLRDGTETHRVVAQEDLMPSGLAELVSYLDRTVEWMLRTQRAEGAVIANLRIDPVLGTPGTERNLHLTLLNASDRPVTFHTADGQLYNFVLTPSPRIPGVTDAPGTSGITSDEVLWDWQVGRGWTTAPREYTLQPGESLLYEQQWPGLDYEGHPVPPGRYAMTAVMMTQISPVVIEAVVIE
jgi:hypothetical protein